MANTIKLLGILCLGFGVTGLSAQAKPAWQAGVAKTMITPVKPMWMAGYASRNRPAAGTSTDLWCKALLLDDGSGNRGLVITLDLIGIDADLAADWCEKIEKQWRISRESIVLSTSHTHSGPVIVRNLKPLHFELLDAQQQALAVDYKHWLTERVIETVASAVKDLAPAQLSWGSGKTQFAANRRNNPENEIMRRRAESKIVGPSDHDVPVLAVRSANQQLRAVLFGYACHATTLSWYFWSADYPGHAQMTLQQRHPGCIAMFWAGCGGDQNPLPRRKIELAQKYGVELADAVDEVLKGKLEPLPPKLITRFTTIGLSFAEVPERSEIELQRESKNRYVVARANMWLKRMDQGEKVPAEYPYTIGYWSLGGQIEWFSLGGEVVVDYAVRLKSQRSGKRTWVAGYSHDVMAYIPSLRVLREGGYEGGGSMVYYGLFSPWSEQVEEDIIRAAKELAGGALKPSTP